MRQFVAVETSTEFFAILSDLQYIVCLAAMTLRCRERVSCAVASLRARRGNCFTDSFLGCDRIARIVFQQSHNMTTVDVTVELDSFAGKRRRHSSRPFPLCAVRLRNKREFTNEYSAPWTGANSINAVNSGGNSKFVRIRLQIVDQSKEISKSSFLCRDGSAFVNVPQLEKWT